MRVCDKGMFNLVLKQLKEERNRMKFTELMQMEAITIRTRRLWVRKNIQQMCIQDIKKKMKPVR